MNTLLADLKLAARMLRKNPGFALVAVAALGLGIGANTAIFSIVNAVLLNPLPYLDSGRIVVLERTFPGGERGASVPVPDFTFWAANTGRILDDVSAYNSGSVGLSLAGGDRPQQVDSLQVSRNYFHLFGANPVLGRTFSPQEDRPGGSHVVVISHGLWERRFGADHSILGRTIVLNSEPYRVVGVLPDHFQPPVEADVWLPLQADPASTNHANYLGVAARLKPGVSLAQAHTAMKVVASAFRSARGTDYVGKNESAGVRTLVEKTVVSVRPMLLILMGAVGFVLLIACANVANLLLARAAARQRELAIRAAVGAGRGRIVRQLLTESVLLAAIASAAGLLIGIWGSQGLLAIAPAGLPRAAELASGTPLNASVLLFTVGAGLLTTVLFGLMPALQASRPDLNATLKEASGRSGSSLRQNKARGMLVIAETAISVVLLVGAVLMIRTFVGLAHVNPGFDPHHILTMNTSFAGDRWATTAAVSRYEDTVLQRLKGAPGVEAASSLVEFPGSGDNLDLPFIIEGRPLGGRRFHGDVYWRPISPDFFVVFRIPLLAGRTFDRRDTTSAPAVAIVNQAMAKKFWKNQDPIGQRIVVPSGLGPISDAPRMIVGIVGSVRETSLTGDLDPVWYIPSAQIPDDFSRFMNALIPRQWAIRTEGDPLKMSRAIQAQFTAADEQVAVAKVRSMDQVLAASTSQQTFGMQLLGVFAGVALLLAAIGIYGVVSYMVDQRATEIGIRMALGARPAQVLRLVAGQGMVLAGLGIALGLAGAFGLTRLMQGLLYGVKPGDPLTYVAAGLGLLAVSAAACYFPAMRATRLDPVNVLRQE